MEDIFKNYKTLQWAPVAWCLAIWVWTPVTRVQMSLGLLFLNLHICSPTQQYYLLLFYSETEEPSKYFRLGSNRSLLNSAYIKAHGWSARKLTRNVVPLSATPLTSLWQKSSDSDPFLWWKQHLLTISKYNGVLFAPEPKPHARSCFLRCEPPILADFSLPLNIFISPS